VGGRVPPTAPTYPLGRASFGRRAVGGLGKITALVELAGGYGAI